MWALSGGKRGLTVDLNEEADDSDSPGTKVRIPLWLPGVGLVFGLLFASILALVAVSIQHQRAPSGLDPFTLVLDEIGLWVAFLLAALYGSRKYGSGSLVKDFGLRVSFWPDIPLGLAIGVICQLGVVPLLYLPFAAGNPALTRSLSRPAQTLIGSGRQGGEIFVALVIVIGAPIMEELFFRGLLLTSVRSSFARMGARTASVLAVVVSGLVFGLAHFEKLQFPGLVVVGIILGVLALRTRRLGMSIAAHMGFNLVAFISVVTSFR